MGQEELRIKIIKLKETKGTPYSFIAAKIGCSRSTVSLFIDKKRKIPKWAEDNLIKFLDEALN